MFPLILNFENFLCHCSYHFGSFYVYFLFFISLFISNTFGTSFWALNASHCWRLLLLHRFHDDVIKWKHFLRYWPFVRGIHRSPVDSPHKGQWRGALMFSLIWVWINGWVNSPDAGDLRRHCAHCDVIVILPFDYFPLFRAVIMPSCYFFHIYHC